MLHTSAVTVALGAKPWPGLIDSICCPVGILLWGSKVMEAWPGRNSIQIQNKKQNFNIFVQRAWKLFFSSEATTEASLTCYTSEKR